MTDHGFNFPVIKVTLIANVLWSLRLIDNRKYKQETIVKSSETEIKIHANPELASIVLWTGPRGVSLRGFSELLRKYRMNRQIPWENTLGEYPGENTLLRFIKPDLPEIPFPSTKKHTRTNVQDWGYIVLKYKHNWGPNDWYKRGLIPSRNLTI